MPVPRCSNELVNPAVREKNTSRIRRLPLAAGRIEGVTRPSLQQLIRGIDMSVEGDVR
jgi:hypothetical protein